MGKFVRSIFIIAVLMFLTVACWKVAQWRNDYKVQKNLEEHFSNADFSKMEESLDDLINYTPLIIDIP